MTKDTPLVSIIVITYNSAKFVLETLDSAKAQTYQNIELIISDDGSTDDTIAICQQWLTANAERFVRSELLTVAKNTGIPANCNRGVRASKGEWVKLIAGDDQLRERCIEYNISYIQTKYDIKALQTVSRYYHDTFAEDSYFSSAPYDNNFFNVSAIQQYKSLLNKNTIVAPSMILKKSCILEVGGFDEEFKLMEDITMWLTLTKSGINIHFYNAETVNYRVHRLSVARTGKVNISQAFCVEQINFYKKYIPKSMSSICAILKYKTLIAFDRIGLNNNSVLSKYLYMVTWKLLTK